MIRTMKNSRPTLREAQGIVGGYVEMIRLEDGGQMLVDEDGLSKNLEFNMEASSLAGRPIVGPVLLLYGAARWID
jgi:Domain of unknown function (DUF3846)